MRIFVYFSPDKCYGNYRTYEITPYKRAEDHITIFECDDFTNVLFKAQEALRVAGVSLSETNIMLSDDFPV